MFFISSLRRVLDNLHEIISPESFQSEKIVQSSLLSRLPPIQLDYSYIVTRINIEPMTSLSDTTIDISNLEIELSKNIEGRVGASHTDSEADMPNMCVKNVSITFADTPALSIVLENLVIDSSPTTSIDTIKFMDNLLVFSSFHGIRCTNVSHADISCAIDQVTCEELQNHQAKWILAVMHPIQLFSDTAILSTFLSKCVIKFLSFSSKDDKMSLKFYSWSSKFEPFTVSFDECTLCYSLSTIRAVVISHESLSDMVIKSKEEAQHLIQIDHSTRKITVAPVEINKEYTFLCEFLRSVLVFIKNRIYLFDFLLVAPVVAVSTVVDEEHKFSVTTSIHIEVKDGILQINLNDLDMFYNKSMILNKGNAFMILQPKQTTLCLLPFQLKLTITEFYKLISFLSDYSLSNLFIDQLTINFSQFTISICQASHEPSFKLPIFSFNFQESEFKGFPFRVDFDFRFHNPSTFFDDVVIDSTTLEVTAVTSPTEKKMQFSLVDDVNVNISTQMVNLFVDLYIRPIVPTIKTSLLIKNATSETLMLNIGRSANVLTVDAGTSLEVNSSIITIHHWELPKPLTLDIRKATKPMLIWPNIVLSMSSKDFQKVITLSPLVYIKNDMPFTVYLYSIIKNTSSLICTARPGCKIPLMTTIKEGEVIAFNNQKTEPKKNHHFIFSYKKMNKEFTFTENNGSIQSIVEIDVDKKRLHRTICIGPVFYVTSDIKKSISIDIRDSDGRHVMHVEPGKRYPIHAIGDTICTFEPVGSLDGIYPIKSIFDSIPFRIDTDTYRIASTQDRTGRTMLWIYGQMLIENTSCFDLELSFQSDRKYSLPKSKYLYSDFSKQLTIFNGTEYETCEIQTNSETQFTIEFSSGQSLLIKLSTKEAPYGRIQKVSIENSTIIFNNLLMPLKIISDNSIQDLVPGEMSPLAIVSKARVYTIQIGDFKPVPDIVFNCIMFTTIRLVSKSKEFFVDLTCDIIDGIANISFEAPSPNYRFSLNNDLEEHRIFVQQNLNRIPMVIDPKTTKQIGFEYPFKSKSLTVTIEGIKTEVDISENLNSSPLSFIIGNNPVYINILTFSKGRRQILISHDKYPTVNKKTIELLVPSMKMTLIDQSYTTFLKVAVNSLSLKLFRSKSVHQTLFTIQDIELLTDNIPFFIGKGDSSSPYMSITSLNRKSLAIFDTTQIDIVTGQSEVILSDYLINSLKTANNEFSTSFEKLRNHFDPNKILIALNSGKLRIGRIKVYNSKKKAMPKCFFIDMNEFSIQNAINRGGFFLQLGNLIKNAFTFNITKFISSSTYKPNLVLYYTKGIAEKIGFGQGTFSISSSISPVDWITEVDISSSAVEISVPRESDVSTNPHLSIPRKQVFQRFRVLNTIDSLKLNPYPILSQILTKPLKKQKMIAGAIMRKHSRGLAILTETLYHIDTTTKSIIAEIPLSSISDIEMKESNLTIFIPPHKTKSTVKTIVIEMDKTSDTEQFGLLILSLIMQISNGSDLL